VNKKILLFLVLFGFLLFTIPFLYAQAAVPSDQPRPAAPAATPEIFVSDYNNVGSLTVTNTAVYWTVTCGGEINPPLSHIKSKQTGGGGIHQLFGPPVCDGSMVISNVAADASYVYWQNLNGQVLRLPVGASVGSPPELVATKETVDDWGDVAVDGTYVYWIENSASPTSGKLFRILKTGGVPELMAEFDTLLSKLMADGNGNVFYINNVGLDTALMRSYYSGGAFSYDYLDDYVQSYTIGGGWLYLAHAYGDVQIFRAPLSQPSSLTFWYDIDDTGSPVVRTMALDDTNLYWHEYRSPDGGPIYRRALSGGSADLLTNTMLYAGTLGSNNRYLFWNDYNVIYRLPVNASTFTLDLVANEMPMEVVQAIQNPTNDVPLVSNKETFVRVYARIASSSGGYTLLNPWPPAVLYGSRDGIPLPESPLTPISLSPALLDTLNDRTQLDQSILFRLPPGWTDGAVILQAMVNPRHVLPETDYTNNLTTPLTATFNRKSPMCLDIMPVSTVRGVSISTWDEAASQRQFFTKATSLLPSPELRTFFRGGTPLTKPRWYLTDSDPFTVSTASPDAGWLVFWLDTRTMFSSAPAGCSAANAVTTHLAMLQDFTEREVNGMALSWSLLFFNFPEAPTDQNEPGGGVTLAHELGHIYGRKHVNCPAGTPADPDPDYPYADKCTLDNPGSTNHIGYDSFTSQLVLPDITGDLMSYAHFLGLGRWPSDYTWKAIYNRLNNGLSGLVAQPGMAMTNASQTYLASGVISGTTVYFNHAYELTGALLDDATQRIADQTVVSPDYELQAFDVHGSLIATTPLTIANLEDLNSTDVPFFTLIGVDVQLGHLEVLKRGETIGTLKAGENPPELNITSPTAGATIGSSLTIAWQGYDADGDLLRYVVRYSPDKGNTWIAMDASGTQNQVVVDTTNGLPGGAQAWVEVIASDGLHTTTASVGPFSVPLHDPEAKIYDAEYHELNSVMGTAIAQSEIAVLNGDGYDAEDGPLSGTSLQWRIIGPVTRYGSGNQMILANLPPGTYSVNLQATDSNAQTGGATTTLTVSPKRVFDATTPTLDGYCDDAAYEGDLDPVELRYSDGTIAQVRFVHADGAMFACFNGMPVGSDAASFAGLRVDVNNSRDSVPQTDDRGFFVNLEGVAFSVHGDGVGEFTFDALPQGLTAAISQVEDHWNAELRIDESQIGGWNHLVGMRATQYWRNYTGDDTPWPVESAYNVPSTWGLTTLGPLNQTITFNPLSDRSLKDSPFAISATTSSGLPVTFNSSTSAICTVDGFNVTLVSMGVCTIVASQPGDYSYNAAADVSRSFKVITRVFLPVTWKH